MRTIPHKKFTRMLHSLARGNSVAKLVHQKVVGAIEQWEHGENARLTKTKHGERRIKNCVKYELPNGYRLITVEKGSNRILLFVGTHDSSDLWLENHRGLEPSVSKRGRIDLIAISDEISDAKSVKDDRLLAFDTETRTVLKAIPSEALSYLDLPKTVQVGLKLISINNLTEEDELWDHIFDLKYSSDEQACATLDVIRHVGNGEVEEAVTRAQLFAEEATTSSSAIDQAIDQGTSTDTVISINPEQMEELKKIVESHSYSDWLEELGGECVFSSEWNSYSQKTYEKWFGEKPIGDINTIPYADIPDHDILCAGFPCQPFSLAGVSKKNSLGRPHGFDCEEQGNLFFNILDIAKTKRPPILILENVKNLKSHDGGETWKEIQKNLDNIGYHVEHDVVDASHWVPQHRSRIFIVCFDKKQFRNKEWRQYYFPDLFPDSRETLEDILEKEPDSKHVLSTKLWSYLKSYKRKHAAQGSGFGYGLIENPKTEITRTLSARYHKDGSEILISRGGRKNPRRLTVVEAARLMGFASKVNHREDIPVSDAQAYRQFGNAVVPAAVTAVARPCLLILKSLHETNFQEA